MVGTIPLYAEQRLYQELFDPEKIDNDNIDNSKGYLQRFNACEKIYYLNNLINALDAVRDSISPHLQEQEEEERDLCTRGAHIIS